MFPSSNTASGAFHSIGVKPALLLVMLLAWLALPAAGLARVYVVRSGDSLDRIAQRELGSSIRWQEIATLNRIAPPYRLQLGQQLQLPDAAPATNAPAPVPVPVASPRLVSTNVPTRVVTNAPVSTAAPVAVSKPEVASEPWKTVFHDLPMNGWTISMVVAGMIVLLLFYQAVILWISCWFSLVEAGFIRCFILAFKLLVIGILCVASVLGLVLLSGGAAATGGEATTFGIMFMTIPVSFVIWFVAGLFVMKRTLECKWRSVVTILVMSNAIAWNGGILVMSAVGLTPWIFRWIQMTPSPW